MKISVEGGTLGVKATALVDKKKKKRVLAI